MEPDAVHNASAVDILPSREEIVGPRYRCASRHVYHAGQWSQAGVKHDPFLHLPTPCHTTGREDEAPIACSGGSKHLGGAFDPVAQRCQILGLRAVGR